MNARRAIAARLWLSVPSKDNAEAKTRTEEMLDAYRAEVLAKAIGRLRAIPVTCTALTGPVWYGDGWNSAITQLEEIADYQTPDDEAYPGELERLRTLALQLRVAVVRKGDLAKAEWLLSVYEEHRKQASAGAPTATPDFFQPGHAYRRDSTEFHCKVLDPSPATGERRAIGWQFSPVNGIHGWHVTALDPDDWKHGGWSDVTEGGEAS